MNEEVKVLDMTHADEVIREVEGGAAPTMQSRMGTGGNQVPLIMDRASEPTVCIEGDLTRPSHMGSGVSTDGASFTLQAREAATKQHGVAIGVSFDGRKDAPVIPECAHTECVGTNPGFKNGAAICIDAYNQSSSEESCMTLRSAMGGTDRNDADPKICVGVDGYNQSVTGDASKPLGHSATDTDHTPAVALNHIVRRLTPTECERLQAFPDGWTRIPYRGKPAEECPDSPRYKALGNSMATNCVEWVLRRIVAAVRLGMIGGQE